MAGGGGRCGHSTPPAKRSTEGGSSRDAGPVSKRLVGSGRRGTGVATGPFPQTALQTGRAPSKASGSPRPHGAGLARGRCQVENPSTR